jgi:AMMECR1 domain-containing protein
MASALHTELSPHPRISSLKASLQTNKQKKQTNKQKNLSREQLVLFRTLASSNPGLGTLRGSMSDI